MTLEELQYHTEQPKELFLTDTTINIAYDSDREEELDAVVDDLNELFKGKENFIFITNNGRFRADMKVCKADSSIILEFIDVPCPSLALKDIAKIANTEETVTINFFLYDKESERVYEGKTYYERNIHKIILIGTFKIKTAY